MVDKLKLNTAFVVPIVQNGKKNEIPIPPEIEEVIIGGHAILFCLKGEEVAKGFFIIKIVNGKRVTFNVKDFGTIDPQELVRSMEDGTIAIPEKISNNIEDGCAFVFNNNKYYLTLREGISYIEKIENTVILTIHK